MGLVCLYIFADIVSIYPRPCPPAPSPILYYTALAERRHEGVRRSESCLAASSAKASLPPAIIGDKEATISSYHLPLSSPATIPSYRTR